MLPQELEQLIEMALLDGVVTEQEKQVLYRKAQEFGVDMDEFQMILDAKIYKASQAAKPAAPAPAAPQTNSKHGGMRKCPSCGSPISGFSTSCTECGYEFSDVGAVKSASQLFEQLQEIERKKGRELAEHNQRKAQELSNLNQLHNSGGAFSKLVSSKSAQKQERDDLIAALEREAKAIEQKYMDEKLNVIKVFTVPNTKEDLMELLSMAASNAYDNDGVIGKEEEAWLQKTDQIYQKIMITCQTDPGTLNQATSLIASLIKRLPAPYKSFTRIPKEQRDIITRELKAEKKERQNERMQTLKEICFGWMGITLAICILCCIIGFWIDVIVVALIGLVGLVVIVKLMVDKYKDSKDDVLYN